MFDDGQSVDDRETSKFYSAADENLKITSAVESNSAILDKSVEPDTPPPQQTIQLDIFHSTFIFLERKNPTALKVEINSFFKIY